MAAPFVLFDLDNTLYPASAGVLPEMNRRIGRFVADFFDVPMDEAERLRRIRPDRYGTTLQWLRICHGLTDPEPFIDAVHPADMAAFVEPDPELRDFLGRLAADFVLFTNSPREHAERTLDALDLADLFPRIWDLRRLGYRGKPHRCAYERVLGDLGLRPQDAILVDDSPANIAGFRNLGGRVLFVDDVPPASWIRDLSAALEA